MGEQKRLPQDLQAAHDKRRARREYIANTKAQLERSESELAAIDSEIEQLQAREVQVQAYAAKNGLDEATARAELHQRRSKAKAAGDGSDVMRMSPSEYARHKAEKHGIHS